MDRESHLPSALDGTDTGKDLPTVVIVDWSVTKKSPIGSGILELLNGLHARYRFVVVAADFENSFPQSIEHVSVRIPRGPAFVKELCWPTLVRRAFRHNAVLRSSQFVVRATQGQLPGAEVCDAHFCHRAYLDRYFKTSGTKGLRRITRYLVHRHGARLEKRAFARARVVSVPSVGLQREISEIYPFTREKLVHIPNPVDVDWFARDEQFDRAGARSELGYGHEELVFVFVGLGDFGRKGLEIGIRALGVSGSDLARILVVGGTTSEIALFRKVASDVGAGRKVQFVGFQSDVRRYLWLSDVFLFPTVYEAAPKVIDQATSAGLPTIATRVHGIEERIEHGVNGWFVERTAQSVAEAMKAAVDARQQLPEMGRRAHEVARTFDRRFYVERWDELLAQVLAAAAASLEGTEVQGTRAPA